MLKKVMTVLMLISFATFFAGCEGTLKGMGEDLEKMGKSIQDSVGSSDKPEDSKDSDKK